jgi:hypothetical protein
MLDTKFKTVKKVTMATRRIDIAQILHEMLRSRAFMMLM